MSKRPITDVVTTYWRHFRYAHGDPRDRVKADARFWAVEEVSAIQQAGGQASVDLVIALAEGAYTDEELAYLGAGPIEDLFSLCSSDPPLDEFERALISHNKVRQAFQYAWLHALPPEVAERLGKYHEQTP